VKTNTSVFHVDLPTEIPTRNNNPDEIKEICYAGEFVLSQKPL
jgi:hypothetical protein